MFKIGWFSTGRDQAAQDLLVRVVYEIQRGEIPQSEISYVFCNREQGESEESDKFLDMVLRLGIPLKAVSSAKFEPKFREENSYVWRYCYHSQLRALLKDFKEDVRVLSGYMLVLDPETCFKKPTINLHPALPNGPKGTFEQVIWQLIEKKERESGVMIHLVTPELDRGPAITFCRFPLRIPHKTEDLWREVDLLKDGEHRKRLFARIREEELKREFPLVVETLKLLAQGRVKIQMWEQKILNSTGEALDSGLDLTSKVERQIN